MNSKCNMKISARFQQAFDVIAASSEFLIDDENKFDQSSLDRALFPEIQILLRVLIDDEFFIGDVLSKCSEEMSDNSQSYVRLLSFIMQQLSREHSNVTEKWFVEDLMGTTVIDLFFKHLPFVTAEMMSCAVTGKRRKYSSYDHMFTTLRELLLFIPKKCFCVIENCLISNILNENTICYLMASDVWFFILSNANDNLRVQHCKLLFKLTSLSSGYKQRNVKVFLERVLPLLNQQQIEKMMEKFNPLKHSVAWCNSYGCEAERNLCISFLNNYDFRKSSSNILPLISSFLLKAENIDEKYREKFVFIAVIALKYNIEEKHDLSAIPELLNALSKHASHLRRDVISSISYSLCYSHLQDDDTHKYLFCHLCDLFIHSLTSSQQKAFVECLVKCYSEQCSGYVKSTLHRHLLYLCTTYSNLGKLCPLINSKHEVREGLIEFIEAKKNCLSNPMSSDEKESLMRKIFTTNQSYGV